MKLNIFVLLLCFSITSSGQEKSIRNFIFGHSLIDHRPPLIPTPSDETTVPHWIYLFAQHGGHSYAAGGQYGFLPQHQNTPPISQWGYDIVPGVWESDTETFDEAELTTIIITAGNFIQYQAPSENYYNDEGTSPISASERIIDFVGNKRIYIYENWPDMAGFIAGEGFPPSPSELATYNENTLGEFHDWWLTYHDALVLSRPESEVKMIPVGPIIAEVIERFLENTDVTELYEDNAPHGRPSIYFLASAISYMAIFEEKISSDFQVPDIIHGEISQNFEEIIDYAWTYLVEFNDPEGNSRVFFQQVSANKHTELSTTKIWPNPSENHININTAYDVDQVVIVDLMGRLVHKEAFTNRVDLPMSSKGLYILSLVSEGEVIYSQLVTFGK